MKLVFIFQRPVFCYVTLKRTEVFFPFVLQLLFRNNKVLAFTFPIWNSYENKYPSLSSLTFIFEDLVQLWFKCCSGLFCDQIDDGGCNAIYHLTFFIAESNIHAPFNMEAFCPDSTDEWFTYGYTAVVLFPSLLTIALRSTVVLFFLPLISLNLDKNH
uniref:Uncharacterized protein n=1 Tax=Xiphophorus couchianus TaxID=32473 RepID=A0A3B5KUJ2_9TELE